jgi:hypothetical protein
MIYCFINNTAGACLKVYSLTYTSLHESVSIYLVGSERYYIVHYCTAYGPG